MTPQEITQIKAISLQTAGGNLEQAKAIFEWLIEDKVTAEVQRQVSIMELALTTQFAQVASEVQSV